MPRCLYPGALPNDVITLPAHELCNKFTSKDEEAFRNHVAVAIQPASAALPLWEKTWRALHRSEGAGMQRKFYSDMLSVPMLDCDGTVRPSPVIAQLEYERADRVLAKIVKGLFLWKTGALLPNDVTWSFGQAENGRDQVRLPNEGRFMVHDVLDVRWGHVAEAPCATTWILGFHGVLWFWVLTVPTGLPTPAEHEKGEVMLWPGPGSTR